MPYIPASSVAPFASSLNSVLSLQYPDIGANQLIKVATIFNFIDGSIREIHTDDTRPISGMDSGESEDQKIREWQKDVVRSIAADDVTTTCDPPQTRAYVRPARPIPPPRNPVVVNQIVTNPPVVVTRVKAPEPKPSDEISTKAIIGTVVGATAGAFIAYAMVKGDSENHRAPRIQERITYRTIEAPIDRPITRIPIQDSRSLHDPFISGNSGVRTIGPPPARAETLISKSEHSQHPSHSDVRSKIASSRDGPIVMIDNEQGSCSPASSGRKTVRQKESFHLPPSAPITEVRTARDVPLPARSQASRYSRASSATIRDPKAPPIESRNETRPLSSVAPNDSISQVSTKMSRHSGGGRSKHHHSSHHGGRSKSGHGSEREYRSADGGSRSKVGDMVDDVVSVIKGTSIKGSKRGSMRG